MNTLRKLLCVLTAVVLAAFALPSSAADKLFSVSISVTGPDGKDTSGVIVPGKTSMVLVDFANRTPLGTTNSVINQVQVTFPLPGDLGLLYNNMTALSKTVNNGSCPAAPAPSPNDPAPSHNTSINLNNITGVKIGGHYCLYLEVQSGDSTCTTTTWQTYAGTGGGNGTPFLDYTTRDPSGVSIGLTADGCDGTLDCGQNAGAVTRGANWGNQTGTCTAKIDYDFNFDPTGQSATSFITLKNGQNFTVEYSLLWNKVLLSSVDDDGDGVPDFHPLVSYQIANPVQNYPNNFDYVPAPACLSGPDILAQGFDPNAVMPMFPNVFPYNKPDVPGGPNVPAQYKTGVQAKMCLAQLGWVSLPGGYVQEKAVVIDQSDSFTWP